MQATLRLRRDDLTWSSYQIDLCERSNCIDTVWSVIYLCPHCRRIWARIELLIWQEQHFVFEMPCSVCPEYRYQRTPGSLLRNLNYISPVIELDDQLLKALPSELLEREFNLHIAALEKDFEPARQSDDPSPSSSSLTSRDLSPPGS